MGLDMKKIGFNTTSLVCEIGNKFEVMFFFKCLNKYITKYDIENIDLVSDRLYKKYVKLDDIECTLGILRRVRNIFESISYEGDFDGGGFGRLNLNGKFLSDVFSGFFEAIELVFEQALVFYREFNRYVPIKIIIADIPGCISWEKKSLNEYESVEGDPLWYLFG
jgi:hypothetical protein